MTFVPEEDRNVYLNDELIKQRLETLKSKYPEKFASDEIIFNNIHRGDRIFISTGCGEPQHLVKLLIDYVQSHPKAFFDTEVVHVWTLGVAPYADEKFKRNFRLNSFFIADSARESVNEGVADYSPIFLSQVPDLLLKGYIDIDVALIQTSYPDEHGYLNLGVSVDIVKAAVAKARLVIAQINSHSPRVHGDGFIKIDDIHYLVPHEEPLLEYDRKTPSEISKKIGTYVSHLVRDGDTIQVGYGSMPNAILSSLNEKKDLGVHTELISDGIVELMKKGVINNTQKTIDSGKAIASFCMGTRETYEYIHDNPTIEFKSIKYTNDPLIIAQHENMVAINSALEIDLTGQATAESIGKTFYSGVGGQADFMRGAVFAPNGKTILALQSTAHGGKVSRIVPAIREGAGITLTRGDVHYVVTEYGIAYLHGKSVRQRAMSLIAIAHPRFRKWLIDEAKVLNLIYKDQAFIAGEGGEYPEELQTYRTVRTGLEIFLRPIKIDDEQALKDFAYSLSEQSMYRRFMSARLDMPHEWLQKYVVIDYTQEMAILATIQGKGQEKIIAVGRYYIDPLKHMAEITFAVTDEYQNMGVGSELLSYLTHLAKQQGLLGFEAEVLMDNTMMLHIFKKAGFEITSQLEGSVYRLRKIF
jgi:acyl-CoA hydrolase/ribosomal protein S18 acetylase RimI-like enzyme